MKRVLLLFCLIFSGLAVQASENVLQSIEIEPVKDTFNIVLVSDKAVDVKKTVQASNKVTLTMKDIRPSKTLNTIYNNVSNVDTVMVEPQGNGISIFFQADNAAASTVTFDALIATAPAKAATQSLKLNNPIESYAPIYNESFEEVKAPSFMDKVKASSAAASIKGAINDGDISDSMNKIFSFGLIGLFAFAVIRLFKRKEPEMKIGLSQSLNEREINMYKGVQPIPQNYQTERPYTSVNYGINAYQKENRNPYETVPSQFHNPKLRSYATSSLPQETVTQTVNRPSASAVAAATQPQVKKMTTPVNSAPVNQSNPNIDNL